jgi:cyclophilin family peptidyl-prolyl cis-trans isomerase
LSGVYHVAEWMLVAAAFPSFLPGFPRRFVPTDLQSMPMSRSTIHSLLLSAALALLGPSCTTLKKGYEGVAKGTRATWNAVAGAGSAVVAGTGKVGRGTADLAGKALRGQFRDDPDHVEIEFAWSGKRAIVLVALDEEAAPQHVENFRKLAKDGFYQGLRVHRALPGYLVQTGDPRSRNESAKPVWGLGGPGYTIPAEIGLPHRRGSIGMARLGSRLNPTRQSNGSQFYICLRDLPELDGEYTVFGRVVAGLEQLDPVSKLETDENDVPLVSVTVESTRLVANPRAPAAAAPDANPPAAAPAKPAAAPAPPAAAKPAVKPAVAPAAPAEPEAKRPGWLRRTLGRIW